MEKTNGSTTEKTPEIKLMEDVLLQKQRDFDAAYQNSIKKYNELFEAMDKYHKMMDEQKANIKQLKLV